MCILLLQANILLYIYIFIFIYNTHVCLFVTIGIYPIVVYLHIPISLNLICSHLSGLASKNSNNFNLSGLKQQVWWMAMKRKGLENSKKRSESFSVQMKWKQTDMEHSQKLFRSKAEMKMGMEMGNRQELATAENGNAVLKSASSLPKPCMQVALLPNWIIARSCAKAMKCFLAIACRCAFAHTSRNYELYLRNKSFNSSKRTSPSKKMLDEASKIFGVGIVLTWNDKIISNNF